MMGRYKRVSSEESDSWYTSAKRSRLHQDDSSGSLRELDYEEEGGQGEKKQSTRPRPGENRQHQQGKRDREDDGNRYDSRDFGRMEAMDAHHDNPTDQRSLPILQSNGACQNNLAAKGRGTVEVCF